MPTRRTFTKAASVAALSAVSYRAVAGANDQIRLGFIGVGNRGDQLLDAFLPHKDSRPVAVCDVYEPYLPAAAKKAGSGCKLEKDYRRVLDDKGVDAVVIATPDHWHAIQFVDACLAGKDVYCEKPLSLTVGEGRAMCRAAADAKRVTQVGLHRRSVSHIIEAMKLVRDGLIGKVSLCKTYFVRNEAPLGIGKLAPAEVPAGLDWEAFLGPASLVPYSPTRGLYKFRWFYDQSGGQVTNTGAHFLDLCQWALGQDAPKTVACLGGKFAVDDDREVPDTLEAVWEYDGALVTFSQINGNGANPNPKNASVEIRGTKGTLYLTDGGGGGYEIVSETNRVEALPALNPIDRTEVRRQSRATKPAGKSVVVKGASESTVPHARNFLDCVRTRKLTACPVETGHRSTTATLLARMALARRQTLHWDAKAERVTNDEAANKLLTYEYRKPYKLG